LAGAVLLVYFWSSQEFGVAARPILGATEVAEQPVSPPTVPASLAVRRAFVSPPPDFATGPEAVRPRRPRLVGFDFLDDPAPPPPVTQPEASSAVAPVEVAAPLPSSDDTAA